ncbi:MAG TPA: hypothetical protein VGP72_20960 [Planctomycetota bacterium]|jgi:hypothetical protein
MMNESTLGRCTDWQQHTLNIFCSASAILVFSVLLGLGLRTPELVEIGFILAAIVAAAAMCVYLFGVCQMRLLEILLLISLLGNAIGFSFRFEVDSGSQPRDLGDLLLLAGLMMAIVAAILPGFCFGLSLVNRMHLEDTLPRLRLLLVSTALMPSLGCALLLPLFIASSSPPSALKAMIIALMPVALLLLLFEAWKLHRLSRSLDEEGKLAVRTTRHSPLVTRHPMYKKRAAPQSSPL